MAHVGAKRLLLIDGDERAAAHLSARLRSLGFAVEVAPDAAVGAELALAAPPSAVIADLWTRGISGVQLCRLLRAEPATEDVPVVLRVGREDPRSRFWAEQAGAAGLVARGRMGDLVRLLRTVTDRAAPADAFFMHVGGNAVEIRDRIAHHLDAALFESVITSEVRRLGTASTFETLFDGLSQLASRITPYRWLAVTTSSPPRFAVHAHPAAVERAELEARGALGVDGRVPALMVVDEDAAEARTSDESTEVRAIPFGDAEVGRLAVAGTSALVEQVHFDLPSLIARELGAPLRMAALMEQAHRLATTDALTSLMNRRAFDAHLEEYAASIARDGRRRSLVLLDIDHFKAVNDQHGHAAGDAVIGAVGRVLGRTRRGVEAVARWGGEEFVALLSTDDMAAAKAVAESLRAEIEGTDVDIGGRAIRVTASFGVTAWALGEPRDGALDRADRAMYEAKSAGRNRVCVGASARTTVLPDVA